MTSKSRGLMMLVSVLGLCLQLSCSRHRPRIAAELEFDADGKIVASTGPDGKKTSFQYDSRGLLIEVVSPNASARYGYDAHGNRIWVRDDAGTTEYYYDAFDRLSAAIWGRGPQRLLAYEYDHVGLPSRISVFNLRPLQNVPRFSAQVARLVKSAASDSSGWNEREQVVLALADQLRAVAASGPAPWLANDISYIRNLQGDLQEIRSEVGTVRFNRSSDGSIVERILPNGVRSVFEYAPDRHISRLSHTDSSGREIASFSYKYDNKGRIQDVSGTDQGLPTETGYVWDDRGRLQKMAVDGAEFLYKFDESSRRLAVASGGKAVTFTFDALGRVVRAKGVAMGVTPQGTMTVKRDENETSEIRYNYQSLPLEIATRNAKFSYVWDGEGNLVSLSRNGKTVHFVPAAGTGLQPPLVEFGEDGAPETKQLVGQSVLARIAPGETQFLLEGASGKPCYFANSQGFLNTDYRYRVASMNGHLSAARLVPASWTRSKIGAGRLPAAFLLASCPCDASSGGAEGGAQWNPSPQQQLADAQWQGWWQGLWASRATIPDARGNLAFVYQTAAYDTFHGSSWGQRTLGAVEYAEGLLYGDVLPTQIFQKLGESWGNLFSIQSNQNKWAAVWATKDAAFEVLTAGSGGPFKAITKFGFEKLFAKPLSAEYASALYKEAVVPSLDKLDLWQFHSLQKGVTVAAGHDAGGVLTAAAKAVERGNEFEDHVHKAYDLISSISESKTNVDWKMSHSPTFQHMAGSPSELKSSEQLGGIQLSSTVQGDIGRISGAVYDSASGSIVLLSHNGDAAVSGLKAEDFAVALRLAYSESPEEAAFSLDPADRKNPRGPWLQKVYYPDGVLAGTDFGKAMFAADWLLKQYSFGVVAELGKPQRIRASAVPGYKSVAALSMAQEHEANQPASMSRFWIVSGEMRIRRDGSAIVFDKASMGVKTKPQVINPNSKTGLSDDDRVRNPIHEEFARLFTEHYDELAAESPELERVRELAKAVAIAKWLRQNNVPVDLGSMHLEKMGLQTADPEAHYQVSALSTSFKKVKQTAIHEGNQQGVLTSTRELYLFGGVDLRSSPDYRSDSSVGELQRVVQEKLKQVDEPRFEVNYGGRSWTGTVLPLSQGAVEKAAHLTYFVRNGNVYKVDSQDRVVEVVGKSGDRARYRDPAKGAAGGVEITGNEGWHAVAEPLKSGMSLQITTTRGNEINVISDSSGAIQSIAVDSKKWAEYRKQGKGSSLRLSQGHYSEVLSYDSEGRITDYHLERPSGPGKAEDESARIEYFADGLPSRLSGSGIPETQWQYDSTGRLQQVTSSTGASITVTYDDEAARTTLEARSGAGGDDFTNSDLAKLVFENNHLVSGESFEAGHVEYKYDNQRLVSIKASWSGETRFSYDREGRPEYVELPSGLRLQYRFGDKAKEASLGTGFKIQIVESGPQRGEELRRPTDIKIGDDHLKLPSVQDKEVVQSFINDFSRLNAAGIVEYIFVKTTDGMATIRLESLGNNKYSKRVASRSSVTEEEIKRLVVDARQSGRPPVREHLRQTLLPRDLSGDSGKIVLYRDSVFYNILPQTFEDSEGVVFASDRVATALQNYRHLKSTKYEPQDFTAFVGYPESKEELETVFSDHPTAAGLDVWQENMAEMRALGRDNGFPVIGMPEMRAFKTKESFLERVSDSKGIIWIVAHGSGHSIRLSNGQLIQVTPADIESLHFRYSPFVVVRVCDGGENGFPAAFLKAGARGVWINKGEVKAPDVNHEITDFIGNLSSYSLYDAVHKTNAANPKSKYSNGLTVELRFGDSIIPNADQKGVLRERSDHRD